MARTTPSYVGLRPASEVASRVHSRSSHSNTACEQMLRRALGRAGLRCRNSTLVLPGRPDIVFSRAKVAVFVDGDFWHGKDWANRRERLAKGTNAAYWTRKIETNMARDGRVNSELQELGWTVIRVWESAIRAGPDTVAAEVLRAVQAGPPFVRGQAEEHNR